MISGTIHARPLVVVDGTNVHRTTRRDPIGNCDRLYPRGTREREREGESGEGEGERERERRERKGRKGETRKGGRRKGGFDRTAIYDREKFVETQLARKAERDTENRVAVT